MTFPRVAAKGGAFSRGEQYGTQARSRIHQCIASYREIFRHRASLEWEQALVHARAFQGAIDAFAPECVAEMRGIAQGAGVAYDHILALNCRSELMFAALQEAKRVPDGECTSFAVLPTASADGHLLLGQNWDWVPFAREVAVVLEVQREDKPGYLTIVEAGMLAKVGFNAAGLGVCTNTLVSAGDTARSGVPYHLLLRALLDMESFESARELLLVTERALSANYLLAHRDGAAANFEAAAGGRATLRVSTPMNGRLAHANHFLDADLARRDTYVRAHPHSLTRLATMAGGLGAGRRVDVEALKAILRSHDNAPNGVCGHPDPRAHPLQSRCTVASVIADLSAGVAWIADGPPCSHDYAAVALPSPVAQAAK